ncbi:MAG: hypothetical protein M1835_000706 [Candelina submexicana]|nr:MAG: hypothetical protein M1835_000706 [Candelina submexicana]
MAKLFFFHHEPEFSGIELTVAAAHINFDFSLVRLEAPPEFTGLGTSLSTLRRQSAEEGPLHVTARKLGALFRGLAPATPELIKAYGRRVSEISEDPAVNPKGTKRHGVFQNQVGADGTSIWAGATSGYDAIALNLLSCMLARLWTGSEATSVWVEMIQARKEEIIRTIKRGESMDYSSLAAARQDITRQQLAEWMPVLELGFLQPTKLRYDSSVNSSC